MSLNLISLNVRGLRNPEKRRAIFHRYRSSCKILCLQETHSDSETEKIWKSEWGGQIYFSHGQTNARGVATLIHPEFHGKTSCLYSDRDGRSITIRVNINDVTLSITNIYAPNKDSPNYMETNIRRTFEVSENIVVIGDFNTVMDPQLDRKNSTEHNHPKSAAKIRELEEELHLHDPWRAQNSNQVRYSWYRNIKRGHEIITQASRIDFALVSHGLSNMTHNCFYLQGLKSDHSAMFIGFNIHKVPRGSGYWKMNTAILRDIEYVRQMNGMILQRKPVQGMSAKEKWELLKKDIQKMSKKYTKARSNERTIAISQLTEKITEMEDRLQTLTSAEIELLENTKIEHDELVSEEIRGVMFRSKVKWNMEGERNTKYFYSLERAKYNAKTCTQIIYEDQIIDDPQQVLDKQREFYQDLYTSDSSVRFEPDFDTETVPKQMIAAKDVPISEEEFTAAIKGLRNGSCPGSDGIPAEFYKMFWKQIKEYLVPAIQESIEEGELHKTAKTGILNLIPKKDKDVRHLKNLRPITLLNTDYKVIEKMVANRMVPALEIVINEDQRGFLPNRRISTNIRKILDITKTAEEEQIDGLILSCDYMKCFDRIETTAVLGAMDKFGFSKELQKIVQMLYTGFQVRVQNNGHFSNYIDVQRSVRQGGPASNALFLTVAEILAVSIRSDSRIKGIMAKQIMNLLNQFADDMDVCSMNETESFSTVIKKIDEFHHHTGFLLNYDKTTVYRIGSAQKSNARHYTAQEMKWTNEGINVLGVNICPDETQLLRKNYNSILEKVNNVLTQWAKRSLSLLGKVNIINTMVASLFVYKMSVLPKIPDEIVKELNEKMVNFLWAGHKPKIKLSILQQQPENGGVKLTNFNTKDDALKIVWVKSVMENTYPAQFVYNTLDSTIKENIWVCNLRDTDVDKLINTTNVFWKDVLKAWCRYHFDAQKKDDQIIWYNSLIKIGGKPVKWKKPQEAGLLTISDLIRGREFISSTEARAQYELTDMQYNSLLSAIPQTIRENIKNKNEPFTDKKYKEFMESTRPVSFVYRNLTTPETDVSVIESKWQLELESEYNFCIAQEVMNISKHTTIAKYRSFQYRLLMRGIITNVQLKQWKIKDSEMCSLCNREKETYHHLFYHCSETKNVWDQAIETCHELNPNSEIDLSYANVICNAISEPVRNINNFICLVTKQYIYAKRCMGKKMTQSVKYVIYSLRNIEKYYAITQNKLKTFHKKWRTLPDCEWKDDDVQQILQQIETIGETS